MISGCALFYLFVLTLSLWPSYVGPVLPKHPARRLGVIACFYFLADVINVGFTRTWGRRPQIIFISLVLAALVLDLWLYGSFWGPPFGLLLFLLIAYVTGHLGLSFILAGILATPG